jgi:N-acylneuraminate cytidylyltransferase
MDVLGVILARAGSKGMPNKCVRNLLGRPVIAYTFDHVAASRRLTDAVLTTDSEPAKALARAAGVTVIDRPAELATDTATVDAAARHAVEAWERDRCTTGLRPVSEDPAAEVIVLLYANVPVRAAGLIDRAIEHLRRTGAHSVRTVTPVSKQHPDWIHRLDGDRMRQFRSNSIYRRQDLEPLYYHDGALAVVTRAALFGALNTPHDHQAFLGADRRALVQRAEDAVDIDEPIDLYLAEAILRRRSAQEDDNG